MASQRNGEDLIKKLYDAVINMDEQSSGEISHRILEEGIDAYQAITQGLAAAMDQVGILYSNHEYFVPELLLCADALYAALDILKPHIKAEQRETKGKIAIGVVEGDMHDIGKNLVRIMFEAAGWTVYDLGKDVKLERFVEEQRRTNCNIMALSALMTTSMQAIPKVIRMIKAQNPDVAVMVGGAPLTREIASQFGADGYAKTAAEAVKEATKMLSTFRKGVK